MADDSFLGGLMGGTQIPTISGFAGDALGALGQSLVFSPSNNPLAGFSSALSRNTAATAAERKKAALLQALKAKGFSDADAQRYVESPGLLSLLLGDKTGAMADPIAVAEASPPGLSTPATGATTGLGGLFGGLGDLFSGGA